jgi:hypothetical protein
MRQWRGYFWQWVTVGHRSAAGSRDPPIAWWWAVELPDVYPPGNHSNVCLCPVPQPCMLLFPAHQWRFTDPIPTEISWDFRVLRRRVRRWLSSGLLHRVVWFTDVSENLAASIISSHRPDDGGSKHLWNVGIRPPDYTVQQPKRQPSWTEISFFSID